MAAMLEIGATVQLQHAGTSCVVTRVLGEGAQGRVFGVRVELPEGRREYALKWYRHGFDTPNQRTILERLIEHGIPSSRFLWPIDLAKADADPSYGYLMPLRPEAFAPISDLLNGRLDLPIATVVTVGMELAEGFLALHAAGLCYRDINLGNVFFDPTGGAVLICDLDNVGIDGVGTAEIAGSPFFAAPEVILGESGPNTATDRFSLAVLLFLMFFLHHPLEGGLVLDYEVFDEHAERDLFGAHPSFIFDPSDPSNRPVPGIHDNASTFWPRFPRFLRELFVTAFTDGLSDPGARITEGVWRRSMGRLRDAVVQCDVCGVDAFYDESTRCANCWACSRAIVLPARLELDSGEAVFLRRGAVITRHHLERNFDFSLVSDVTVHPDDDTLVGLRNMTAVPWQVGLGPDQRTVVGPGRSIRIIGGLVVQFAPGLTGHVVGSDPAPAGTDH